MNAQAEETTENREEERRCVCLLEKREGQLSLDEKERARELYDSQLGRKPPRWSSSLLVSSPALALFGDSDGSFHATKHLCRAKTHYACLFPGILRISAPPCKCGACCEQETLPLLIVFTFLSCLACLMADPCKIRTSNEKTVPRRGAQVYDVWLHFSRCPKVCRCA